MKLFAKQSSSGDGRVFRSGVWSAAIASAVIVLAVLVNLIVRAIPSRYTEFDLSEAGLYTLSESSRQVADDLTQDVTIYYLAQTGNGVLTQVFKDGHWDGKGKWITDVTITNSGTDGVHFGAGGGQERRLRQRRARGECKIEHAR